jgi:hypothetical protein
MPDLCAVRLESSALEGCECQASWHAKITDKEFVASTQFSLVASQGQMRLEEVAKPSELGRTILPGACASRAKNEPEYRL